MQPEEKEQLIQVITREIVARLQSTSSQSDPASLVMNKHLITLLDVLPIRPGSVQSVLVAEKAIVTAAAQDHLKNLRVDLQRESSSIFTADQSGSKCIAILAPRLLRLQWQAIQQAMDGKRYYLDKLTCNRSKIVDALPNIIQGLQTNRYSAAIVIDDLAISFLPELKRQNNVLPVAGWDLSSVKRRPAPLTANLLLLSQHSSSAKKLAEMIATWLSEIK